MNEPAAGSAPLDDADARRILEAADLIVSAADVDDAFETIARDVTARLAGSDPLVLAVMVGGMIPAARLVARLDFAMDLDYVHATRYRGGVRGHTIEWLAYPSQPLEGRTVLVVDDILDEGHTLAAILDYCRARGVAEVLSAVLVHKNHGRGAALPGADFTGVRIGDRYVFGCGMDYRGKFRNLSAIYAVKGL